MISGVAARLAELNRWTGQTPRAGHPPRLPQRTRTKVVIPRADSGRGELASPDSVRAMVAIDLLKYGALGLGLAVVIYASTLLNRYLKEGPYRPDATTMIIYLFAIGAMMFIIASGLHAVETMHDQTTLREQVVALKQQLSDTNDSHCTTLKNSLESIGTTLSALFELENTDLKLTKKRLHEAQDMARADYGPNRQQANAARTMIQTLTNEITDRELSYLITLTNLKSTVDSVRRDCLLFTQK
jgi:hypothetical protein